MEKIKEFMSNPKKTAILGLVGIILMTLLIAISSAVVVDDEFDFFSDFSLELLWNLPLAFLWGLLLILCTLPYMLVLIIYFIIVLMRLCKKKGNIKIANYVLIAGYIVSLAIYILSVGASVGVGIFDFYCLINIIALVVPILYFFNILLGKRNFVNNKIFAIAIILYALYMPIYNILGTDIYFFNTLSYISYISYILIIPYFYNYYKLLKNENIEK